MKRKKFIAGVIGMASIIYVLGSMVGSGMNSTALALIVSVYCLAFCINEDYYE